MKDTVKIADTGNTLIIAHRGASCLERENTLPAFVAAGNRSYFGIETDVHVTLDGELVIMHDSDTSRVSFESKIIERCTLEELRNVRIKDLDGSWRTDLRIPLYSEYLKICRAYGKKAVVELKERFETRYVEKLLDVTGDTSDVIFISFVPENLIDIRSMLPGADIQYLAWNTGGKTLEIIDRYGFDLDLCGLDLANADKTSVDVEKVKLIHGMGKKLNVWTVDSPEHATMLINAGVDMITTNCLE